MKALINEIKKLGNLALFFLISFSYILLVIKLFIESYAIDGYVITKAILGALFAAKAVVIIDTIPLIKRLRKFPLYLEILYKTFFYTLMVLFLGIIERFIHAYRETKAIDEAIKMFFEATKLNHFLAIILCIGVVFLIYNFLQEIDTYLGKGKLRQLFLSRSRKLDSPK